LAEKGRGYQNHVKITRVHIPKQIPKLKKTPVLTNILGNCLRDDDNEVILNLFVDEPVISKKYLSVKKNQTNEKSKWKIWYMLWNMYTNLKIK